ncbi:hypothetical protein LJR143_002454 [Pseudoxanthomonas sp. LjRoot143]|uniref:hypothetical protein n=1 Tax=unclassified Pseudoxanthomonas TaxID=2645906 RepID=UPI00177ACAAA|nr:hypothetical protein [Pseudoxanthomonas sp. PXM01]MBD9469520.1 hypothetical protein [Pseudoxanthomonas sp. PXM01]
MNVVMRLAVVVSTCGLLAACASTGGAASAPPPEQRTLTAEQQYIAYVERIAKRRGIQLTWVNPPRIEEKAGSQQ